LSPIKTVLRAGSHNLQPMPQLAKYLTAAVPRYTSYPTALHFDERVDADAYTRWLHRLDPAAAVSVYVHVPFCRQACWYCGCNMKLAARYGPVTDYVDTLIAEIALVAARAPARLKLQHLHWGGGTPTAVHPDDLARVMQALRAHFDFASNAELAIETDPRTLQPEMILRLGALGFNRASLGVQEFDPAVQAAINRIQPPDLVAAAVDGLRSAGVANINFDLIYGLPHQTVDTLLNTIALCDEMRPNRLALFGYAHVPWMAKKQRLIAPEALPAAQARRQQAREAAAALLTRGYQAVGLDHFARPHDRLAVAARQGVLRRNFQGYTTDTAETLVGFGASAIGRTPEGYVQNLTETGAWTRAVRAGSLPIAKGVAFSGEDKLRAEVIEALMCSRSVDLDPAAKRHGARPDWCANELEALAQMQADGLVTVENKRLSVRPEGAPFVRVIAAAFDAYLPLYAGRHSVAV